MAVADKQIWVLAEPRISDNDHQLWVLGEPKNVLDATPAPPGWTGKISGVTNPAKVMGVEVANIAKVKGVA